MNQENKACQNCKTQFAIEPEDFDFYKKIDVPPPTFCPDCRSVRRMTWRNERSLYKRQCAMTGKDIISCFSPTSEIKVYDRDIWWSDQWDPLFYGLEYNFNIPFFKQFASLLKNVPMPAVFNSKVVDTIYGNHSGHQKNGYLVFACWEGENLSYASKTMNSRDSIDILGSGHIESGYEIVDSEKIYKSAFVQNSENCSDSYFLYECRGCTNCFGCTNLRNKSYYFYNEPYTKEEYYQKIQQLKLNTYSGLIKAKQKFEDIKLQSIHKYANIINARNSTGDNLFNTDNCLNCFDLRDARECKFVNNGGIAMADSYDGYGIGGNAELIYESIDTGDNGQKLLFDIFVWGGNNVLYSYACHGSQNLFGCIGLHKKQYCILNKQYSKEEYERLVPQIIAQMKVMPYEDIRGNTYGFGEFFPSEISPFDYNETIAQENRPITKEVANERGYRWKEEFDRRELAMKNSEELSDAIEEVSDEILKEVIQCQHKRNCSDQCTSGFRITLSELQFYRHFNLPLPRLCSNCRHSERMRLRNPARLWTRKCGCRVFEDNSSHVHRLNACPNEFETTYAPDRPEIVYCEQCYQAEVV